MTDHSIPTIKYSWLQSSFWMSFCIVFNYASMFLLSRGYSNSQIGIVIALAGVISALLQPLAAGVADKSRKLTLRTLILLFCICMLVCAAVLLLPGLWFLCNALFYGILLATLQILTPLVNAIGMECINRGISVNFGLARGIGSISFALMSFLAGTCIERFSTTAIPVLIIFCYLMVFTSAKVFVFRTENGPDTGLHREEAQQKKEVGNETPFFMAYKRFFVLLAGISMLFVCHNMLNNYLFQIMSYHSGGSEEMGIAAGLSAVLELPVMLAFSFMIRKFSSRTLLRVSGLFFTVKALLTLSAGSILGIYLAQPTQMLGFGLFVPASVYYTNALIRPSDRARGQAFMTATNTIGSVFGSLLGGFLMDGKGVLAMLFYAALISAAGTVLVFFSVQACAGETEHTASAG